MISVEEARALIQRAVTPVGVERVPLRAARGRTLRENIVATRAQPPFRASAMDGYALRAADTPGVLHLAGEVSAGRALNRPLAAGECVRIFTGAPLPNGADSILIQEDAVRDGDLLTAPKLISGVHVRRPGVDFNVGDALLGAGRVLDAAAIALAAAAGRASLAVSLAPCVAVLSGGDEIVTPGSIPAEDQIFDSMSFGIAALAETWGARAIADTPFRDDKAMIADAVASIVRTHDLTIIVGGASVGDHDHARPALRALGAEFVFEKVAVRPGKPTWFARLDDKFVLGLPGNPASAFVCAYLFLRPLLATLCSQEPTVQYKHASTRTPLVNNGPRETYLRGTLETDRTGKAWVKVVSDQDSSLLSVFASASALVRRAPHAPPAPDGELVDLIVL